MALPHECLQRLELDSDGDSEDRRLARLICSKQRTGIAES